MKTVRSSKSEMSSRERGPRREEEGGPNNNKSTDLRDTCSGPRALDPPLGPSLSFHLEPAPGGGPRACVPPLEAECGEETLWGFSIDRTLEKPVLSFFFLFLCWVGGEEGGGRGTRMFSQRTLGRPAAGPQRTPGSHSSRPRGGTPWKGGTVRRGLGHAPRPLARLRLRPPTSAPAVQLFFFLLPSHPPPGGHCDRMTGTLVTATAAAATATTTTTTRAKTTVI